MKLTLRPSEPSKHLSAEEIRFPPVISVITYNGTIYYVSPSTTPKDTYNGLTGADAVKKNGYEYVKESEELVEAYGQLRTRFVYRRRKSDEQQKGGAKL